MPDTLLNATVLAQVREIFQKLQRPVELLFFGSESGCDYCEDTRQLLEEIAALSDQLRLSVYDLEQDAEIAQQYRVDKSPAIVIAARESDQILDYGIRFYGIPAGHEFSALIQALIMVSEGDSGLQPETRQFLGALTQPVNLQVFSTPT